MIYIIFWRLEHVIQAIYFKVLFYHFANYNKKNNKNCAGSTKINNEKYHFQSPVRIKSRVQYGG